MFSLISAIGKNQEIGKNNQLIFHVKNDMKFFRDTTLGHKVVMGKNTWNSLPGKLKDRKNIVITRSNIAGPDEVISDLGSFIEANQDSDEEIFIIGGGAIYSAFLPHAKHLYLTEIDASAEDADTFFPHFDKSKYRRTIIRKGSDHGINYSIVKYTKL